MTVTAVRDIDLGLYLKIVSRGAVYNNLNAESALWELMTRKLKKEAEAGGEVRWNMRKTYGVAAAGFVPTTAGAFNKGQKSQLVEAKGYYKDFSLTIDVPLTILKKAEGNVAAYGKPIAEEVEAKGIAMARVLSSSVTQDGTGIIGTVSSATASTSLDTVSVVLKTGNTDRGFIGWILEGDKLKFARLNSTEEAATINYTGTVATPDYWLVTDVDRANATFTVKPYTSADVAINITHALASTDLKASDLVRRYSTSWVDPAAISSSVDYGTMTEQWAGLESLGAADGRLVNNTLMEGALKGSRFGAANDIIDVKYIQQALSQTKLRVGQNRYKYKAAYMAPETEDAMIEANETDRRLSSAKDNERGSPGLKYLHRKDSIAFECDEFIRKDRIFILPEGDVLTFLGSDFDYVKPEGGSQWHLKPNSSGGYNREQQSFMEGCGLFYSQHSGAICTVDGFRLI